MGVTHLSLVLKFIQSNNKPLFSQLGFAQGCVTLFFSSFLATASNKPAWRAVRNFPRSVFKWKVILRFNLCLFTWLAGWLLLVWWWPPANVCYERESFVCCRFVLKKLDFSFAVSFPSLVSAWWLKQTERGDELMKNAKATRFVSICVNHVCNHF